MKAARLFGLVVSLIILGLLPSASRAQTNTAVGVTVSPVIDNIAIKPGQTVNRSIKITNPTSKTLTIYPVTLNFTTDNTQGKPVFYSDAERSSRYSLAAWIKPNVTSLSIPAQQFTELGYTITAPSDAEPGGHYGSILLSTEPPQLSSSSPTQVAVVGLIGTLLLVNVPGDVVTTGAIQALDAPTVLITGPANFTTTVTNTGNTHFRPIGDIKIKNWSGAVAADLTVNDTQGAVLPESQRQFSNSWNFNWKSFGRYTATVTLAYGSPEQVMTDARVFYIFPYWFIALIVLFVLGIIWLVIRRNKKPRAPKPQPVSAPVQPKRPPLVMR